MPFCSLRPCPLYGVVLAKFAVLFLPAYLRSYHFSDQTPFGDHAGSVVDPKLFFSDPNPIFVRVLGQDVIIIKLLIFCDFL
jgi:hypothetical protein